MKRSFTLVVAMLIAIIAEPAVVHSQSNTRGPFVQVDGKYVRWGHPSTDAVTITYTFAQSKATFNDGIARNCLHTEPFTKLLQRSKIEFADFRERVDRALRSWEAVTNIRFVFTEHEAEADVRIAAQTHPYGIAWVNLSVHPQDTSGYRRINKAIICLNPELFWSLATSNKQREPSLDSVIQHEAGHVIGLDHLGRNGFLMSFNYSGVTNFGELDIVAAQTLYGAPTR